MLTLETSYSSDERVRDQLRNYVALRAHTGLAWHAVDGASTRVPFQIVLTILYNYIIVIFIWGGGESVLQHNILILLAVT